MLKRFFAPLAAALVLAACTTPTLFEVTSVTPEADATDVAVDAVVTVTFNLAAAEATLQGGFALATAGGDDVAGVVSYDDATMTATFAPSADLAYGAEYVATVAGTVTTATGQPLGDAVSWSFTTEDEPVPDPAVTSIAIDQDDQGLVVGDSVTLTATVVVVGGASSDFTWTSSDPTVATISDAGLVEALTVGSTTITATSDFDDTKEDSITITVIAPAVTSVAIDQDDQGLVVGEASRSPPPSSSSAAPAATSPGPAATRPSPPSAMPASSKPSPSAAPPSPPPATSTTPRKTASPSPWSRRWSWPMTTLPMPATRT
jgi:hypothetical protein